MKNCLKFIILNIKKLALLFAIILYIVSAVSVFTSHPDRVDEVIITQKYNSESGGKSSVPTFILIGKYSDGHLEDRNVTPSWFSDVEIGDKTYFKTYYNLTILEFIMLLFFVCSSFFLLVMGIVYTMGNWNRIKKWAEN